MQCMQGCFWGIDNYFNKHFKDAIVSSEVGYTGGEIKNPDYRRVCFLLCCPPDCVLRFHLPLQCRQCSNACMMHDGHQLECLSSAQVCSGSTGHAEAVRFEYDPAKTTYGDLVSALFSAKNVLGLRLCCRPPQCAQAAFVPSGGDSSCSPAAVKTMPLMEQSCSAWDAARAWLQQSSRS